MDEELILDAPQEAPVAPVETFEVLEVLIDPPFLCKPFDAYTTSEGLLFCVLFVLLLSALWNFITGGF